MTQAPPITPKDNVPAPPLDLAASFPRPAVADWRAAVEKDLKGADFDKKLVWRTEEGFPVKPLYTAEDLASLGHLGNLPGFPPFVRGTYPLSGVAPPWAIRQDVLQASPEEANAAIRDGLARGVTAVGLRLDNAARQGLDGDDQNARELAGRGGCTLSSIYGLRIALAEIPLDRVPVTIRTGSSALPVLAMLLAFADERSYNRAELVGGVECDPIRDLARAGHTRAPLPRLFREMTDMVDLCSRECPGIRPVMVNSHAWHNAGGSMTQELGCVLAVGAEYMRQMMKRGISPDNAALGMTFSVSVTSNILMEIAKLRALRMLWARVAKALGAHTEDAWRAFVHARTSTRTKSRLDPWNNLVRNSAEAFAAVVGGADSVYVAPFDEVIGRPEDFGMRLARNQQLLLREEAHLARVVDPGAGSYAIEALTDSMARESWKVFQNIEAQGGIVKALELGVVQKMLGESAQKRHDAVCLRRQSIVGANTYPNTSEKRIVKKPLPRAEFLAERTRRLARLKASRSYVSVRRLLGEMARAAQNGRTENILEIAIEAAREGATIGEMTDALCRASLPSERTVIVPVVTRRPAADFEDLRERMERHIANRQTARPKALLVTFGPAAMRRARADFSHGFLASGGFATDEVGPFHSIEAAAEYVSNQKAPLVVLCSDDPSYTEAATVIGRALRASHPETLLVVAGLPENAEELRAEGVHAFIHLKANAAQMLGMLQDRLKIDKL